MASRVNMRVEWLRQPSFAMSEIPASADAREARRPGRKLPARSNASADHSEAFDTVYRQEHARIYRYLRARAGPQAARDLVQEVFLRAARSSMLAGIENPSAFLHCIARNLLVDRARRQRCRITTVPLIEDCDAPCPPDQERAIIAEDLAASLDAALEALPARTRMIFAMSRSQSMTYHDIQQEMGISLAAVEYHMMKALAHLRVQVGRSPSPDPPEK